MKFTETLSRTHQYKKKKYQKFLGKLEQVGNSYSLQRLNSFKSKTVHHRTRTPCIGVFSPFFKIQIKNFPLPQIFYSIITEPSNDLFTADVSNYLIFWLIFRNEFVPKSGNRLNPGTSRHRCYRKKKFYRLKMEALIREPVSLVNRLRILHFKNRQVFQGVVIF